MVPIHGTKKLLKLLNQRPSELTDPSKNRLGGWYANVIETPAGDTVLFMSEVAYLSVLVPAFAIDELLPMYVSRVRAMLRQLNLPNEVVQQEMGFYTELLVTKTANRRAVATMNRIGEELWYYVEAQLQRTNGPLSLLDVEVNINDTLRGPEPYFKPAERAREVLLLNRAD